MAYGSTATVKTDLNIVGTAFDTQLSDWLLKADEEVDDIIWRIAEKRRLITQLPELPLTAAELTETIKDASNHLIRKRYYLSLKNPEMAKMEQDEGKRLVDQFLDRIGTNVFIYGRTVR